VRGLMGGNEPSEPVRSRAWRPAGFEIGFQTLFAREEAETFRLFPFVLPESRRLPGYLDGDGWIDP
jgi:hypothetical protein